MAKKNLHVAFTALVEFQMGSDLNRNITQIGPPNAIFGDISEMLYRQNGHKYRSWV